jgi:hypothetical protein
MCRRAIRVRMPRSSNRRNNNQQLAKTSKAEVSLGECLRLNAIAS